VVKHKLHMYTVKHETWHCDVCGAEQPVGESLAFVNPGLGVPAKHGWNGLYEGQIAEGCTKHGWWNWVCLRCAREKGLLW